MGRFHLRSLRARVLWPLAMVSGVVVLCVVLASFGFADWQSEAEQNRRFASISTTLKQADIPLAPNVMDAISQLVDTPLATLNAQFQVVHHTLPDDWDLTQLSELLAVADGQVIQLGQHRFRCRRFRSQTPASLSGERWAIVLFDEGERLAARTRYALLPVVTGLTTTLFLSVLALTMSGKLIGRIQRLETRVARIAAGDFAPVEPDMADDEIGQLSRSVEQMGRDLDGLWSAVNRGQRERLIHQLGAGLAHQLRNSLTGARMAVELHNRRCTIPEPNDGSDLQVALRELNRTESDLQRILQLGKSEEPAGDSQPLDECVQDALAGTLPLARHLHVDVATELSPGCAQVQVAHPAALRNAVNNLVLNAIQAGGDRVQVHINVKRSMLDIQVSDNGAGPPEGVREELFEPFVTSKPEGLGLGLAVVRRCAGAMHGSVTWSRDQGWTVFTLRGRI